MPWRSRPKLPQAAGRAIGSANSDGLPPFAPDGLRICGLFCLCSRGATCIQYIRGAVQEEAQTPGPRYFQFNISGATCGALGTYIPPNPNGLRVFRFSWAGNISYRVFDETGAGAKPPEIGGRDFVHFSELNAKQSLDHGCFAALFQPYVAKWTP